MSQAGVQVAFGSDWPVTLPHALLAVYAAVHRGAPHASQTVVPEEAITADQALRAHTIDAAHMAGLDSLLGALR